MSITMNDLALLQLEEQIKKFRGFENPSKGWIHAIRKIFNMPYKYLQKRLGISAQAIYNFEQVEPKGEITIKTLEKIANAMHCKLVYAFVPIERPIKILEKRAEYMAKKQLDLVSQHMSLEDQTTSMKFKKQQLQKIKYQLLNGDIKKLWSEENV